jgi:hypothetical protein
MSHCAAFMKESLGEGMALGMETSWIRSVHYASWGGYPGKEKAPMAPMDPRPRNAQKKANDESEA